MVLIVVTIHVDDLAVSLEDGCLDRHGSVSISAGALRRREQGLSEALLQIHNDVGGLIHPGGIAFVIGNSEAGNLDLAATGEQLFPAGLLSERVAGFDIERQAFDCPPGLDAKGAHLELIQHQVVAAGINLLLFLRGADHAAWRVELVPEQDDRADDILCSLEEVFKKQSHAIRSRNYHE